MENWGNLWHLFVTVFLSNFAALVTNLAIADVTMEAVCPGKDECSLAIYLTGFQQAIAGLGSVVLMPLIGNMSDAYGRKALLTIPMTLSIIPLGILALKRTTNYFYAYYVLKTITAMVSEGGVLCLALGYLADSVSEGKRVSAFGVLAGVVAGASVCSTFAARLLSTAQIFQVAAAVSIAAALYMRIFLKDLTPHTNVLEEPILKPETERDQVGCESLREIDFFKQIPSPKDIIHLLKSSTTFSVAAFVAFFNSLAEAGVQAFLMYYLKARFQFKKDQYADIWLITYIGATMSNMLFMPILGPLIGEETLLSVGLFAGFLNMLLYSIAWSSWVPYVSACLGVFLFLASPSIRCIVSKQVGPCEQGIAQGCLLGIASFANVISPLIYSPLSALFLSEGAPFNFPGFSIMCIGLAWLIGFILSIVIKIIPLIPKDEEVHGSLNGKTRPAPTLV
ncbi:Major facilitator superfamily protein [Forsythia ovata]|uniref:Major facilitator superfamily protein n=1 Tax=Forsythia ovata TaxID=205694 RepID=A0ABD1QL08_9LAMI